MKLNNFETARHYRLISRSSSFMFQKKKKKNDEMTTKSLQVTNIIIINKYFFFTYIVFKWVDTQICKNKKEKITNPYFFLRKGFTVFKFGSTDYFVNFN